MQHAYTCILHASVTFVCDNWRKQFTIAPPVAIATEGVHPTALLYGEDEILDGLLPRGCPDMHRGF